MNSYLILEQELDYEVSVRLAGSARIVVNRPLSGARQVEHEIVPFSRRRTNQKQRDCIFDVPTSSTFESAPISRWIESPSIDHEQPGSVQANMSPTARIYESREELGSQLPVLYSYITSKYGTPVDQLQHLSSSGCFKNASVESSGHGDGSVIHFPPEANITLPTPTHLVNTSPTTLYPLKLGGTESRLVAEISPGRCSCLETSHGQLNRETRKCTIPNSRLHFESRFEGGNLQRAIEM